MNHLFHSAPINGEAWLRIIALGIAVYFAVGLEKWVRFTLVGHSRPAMTLPATQPQQKPSSTIWRKLIVLLVGGALLLIGVVMLVLPGPAIVFIPLGLAILATEFRWAKNWLTATRQWIRNRLRKYSRGKNER